MPTPVQPRAAGRPGPACQSEGVPLLGTQLGQTHPQCRVGGQRLHGQCDLRPKRRYRDPVPIATPKAAKGAPSRPLPGGPGPWQRSTPDQPRPAPPSASPAPPLPPQATPLAGQRDPGLLQRGLVAWPALSGLGLVGPPPGYWPPPPEPLPQQTPPPAQPHPQRHRGQAGPPQAGHGHTPRPAYLLRPNAGRGHLHPRPSKHSRAVA